MGKIKKLNNSQLVGGTNTEDVYPVTSTLAVYDEDNTQLQTVLDNIESSFSDVSDAIEALDRDKQDNLKTLEISLTGDISELGPLPIITDSTAEGICEALGITSTELTSLIQGEYSYIKTIYSSPGVSSFTFVGTFTGLTSVENSQTTVGYQFIFPATGIAHYGIKENIDSYDSSKSYTIVKWD